MKSHIVFAVACVVMAFAINEAKAHDCTPVSAPTTLSVPGSYCLSGHIWTTGIGIAITGHSITLDMRGYTINCQRAALSRGIEINSIGNVRVMNGRIQSCSWGVRGWGSSGWGLLLRDLHIIDADLRGVQVSGDYPKLERVRAERTGPSRSPGFTQRVVGIEVAGSDVELTDVMADDTYAPGPIDYADSAGISCSHGSRCLLRRPVITQPGPGLGHEFALWVGGNVTATVVSPVVEGFAPDRALYGSSGTVIRGIDVGELEVLGNGGEN